MHGSEWRENRRWSFTAYVTRIGTPPAPSLVAAALRALERIRTKSEAAGTLGGKRRRRGMA